MSLISSSTASTRRRGAGLLAGAVVAALLSLPAQPAAAAPEPATTSGTDQASSSAEQRAQCQQLVTQALTAAGLPTRAPQHTGSPVDRCLQLLAAGRAIEDISPYDSASLGLVPPLLPDCAVASSADAADAAAVNAALDASASPAERCVAVSETLMQPMAQGTGSVQAAATGTASMSGVVTADEGGAPLSGICVIVEREDLGEGTSEDFFALTAENGTWSVSGLPAATDYTARFSACDGTGGYLSEYYDDAREPGDATLIDVADGAQVTGIDASLAPARSISGTVTAAGAGALESICVVAFQPGSSTSGRGAQTAADGRYTISDLADGSYIVQFSECGGEQGAGYRTEYFDNATSISAATPVVVGPGRNATGINAVLETGAAVSGVVRAPDGSALPDVCVFATGSDGSSSAQTGPDGSYRVTGLAPGTVTVTFRDCSASPRYVEEGYNDTYSQDDLTPVPTTVGQTTTGIDATLALGGAVSGVVRASEAPGQSLADICVSVVPRSPDDTEDEFASEQLGGGFTTTGADGSYLVPALRATTHLVSFFDCRGDETGQRYLGESYNNVRPFSEGATLVPVTAAQTTSGIDAALDRAGTISGRVTDASGAPLDQVCVDARLDTADRDDYAGDFTITTADGRYSLRQVYPGNNVVMFSDCSFEGERRNLAPQAYSGKDPRDLAGADRVLVGSGQAVDGIDATLQPGATITGVVRDAASGEPVADACLYAYEPFTGDETDGDLWNGYWSYSFDESGADGSFEMPGLLDGAYVVSVYDCAEQERFFFQYYDRTFDEETATRINVVRGQPTAPIQVQVTSFRVGRGVHRRHGRPRRRLCGGGRLRLHLRSGRALHLGRDGRGRQLRADRPHRRRVRRVGLAAERRGQPPDRQRACDRHGRAACVRAAAGAPGSDAPAERHQGRLHAAGADARRHRRQRVAADGRRADLQRWRRRDLHRHERAGRGLQRHAPGVARRQRSVLGDIVVPFTGTADVVISQSGCPGTISFNIYIDPSGNVYDQFGNPLPGATVTLYRADSGDGQFTVVPDGSAVMAPKNRKNPDLTDEAGHFGWDVVRASTASGRRRRGAGHPGAARSRSSRRRCTRSRRPSSTSRWCSTATGPRHRPRHRPHRRHPRRPPATGAPGELDGARQRRQRDHRLHRHVQPRRPYVRDHQSDQLHGDRLEQRHLLHVHRHRDQRTGTSAASPASNAVTPRAPAVEQPGPQPTTPAPQPPAAGGPTARSIDAACPSVGCRPTRSVMWRPAAPMSGRSAAWCGGRSPTAAPPPATPRRRGDP
jgi:protocatechuate 3,4-dioxygenase beta subunit